MGKAKLRWNEPLISQHESAAEGFTPEDFTEEDRLISKTTESFVKNEVMPLLESIDQQDHESVKKLFQKAGEARFAQYRSSGGLRRPFTQQEAFRVGGRENGSRRIVQRLL